MKKQLSKKIKNTGSSVRDMVAATGSTIAQGMGVVGYVSNEYAFVASAVCALLSLWGNFANKKASDFMQQFIDNKENIVAEIVESNKFISVFLELFERNIKESNEKKRQLIKNYILNMACGLESDFDEHTKIIYVLNSITLEELIFLKLWDDDGIITKEESERKRGSYTISDIVSIAMKHDREHILLKDRNMQIKQNQVGSNQILLSLGYKDLLYVLGATNFGSGEEARVQGITNFGKVFLKFIKK